MSDYGRIVTTNQGKNMVTESIRTHSAIIFTKISLGDGLLNGETIETMTGLKHRLMDGNVPKINHLGNGEIEAVSTVSNSELTAGFFARELGLFAKLGEEGEEQLFAYTNAGSNASYIPPNTSVDEKMLGIQLGVGDAIVQVNYQSHLYITYEQLEDGIAHHNSDEHAHDNRFNAIIQQVNNMITNVDNSNSLAKAPTLQLVKTILSGLNIKNATDVVNALESEKATGLGIRYDFSNVNAWYICLGKLFGNLIIQGGNDNDAQAYYDIGSQQRQEQFTFPISFKSKPLYVHPYAINKVELRHLSRIGISDSQITSTGFAAVISENSNVIEQIKMRYIALGV
nr:MAG TPA: tail-collar fiber protein [Caudoviricetes sp.]